jgi:hypothetical protein
LAALVAACQQKHNLASASREIHAITGAIIDSQFADAFTDRFGIARVSHGQTLNPRLNPRSSTDVTQVVNPLGELVCLT